MTRGYMGKTKAHLGKKLEEPYHQVTDLSDSEAVLHTLEASELRYRRLFETAQDGILILDAVTGEITDVNPYLEEMLGYSKEEFLGKGLWEIGPFKDIELSQKAFQRLQTKGYVRYENLPLETKNGHQISVEFVSNVYPINDDKVIQCNIRDITSRKRAEDTLEKLSSELETRVKERTAQLAKANQELVQEINERKQAEKALRESQERYRELAELLPQTVFEIDETGNFVFTNHYGLETSGYTQQDINKGLSAIQLFIPEDRNRLRENIRRILAGEQLNGIEYMAMRKDGSTFPVLTYSAPITRGDKSVGLRGLVIDITERKQAQEALERTVKLLNDTGEMAEVGGWELDLSTNVVSWTAAVCQIHGVKSGYKPTLEEALEFYPPESRPDVDTAVKRAAKTGEPYDIQCLFLPRGSKDKIWVRSIGRAIYSDGKIVKLTGTFQKIDEYKKSEEALKESEGRYRSLIQLGADVGEAIVMLQDEGPKEGVHVFCNDTWPRITGYSNKELRNTSFFDLVHPKDRNNSLKRYRRRMSCKNMPGLFEITIVRKDGIEIPVEATTAYTTYHGKPANVAYLRDITNRKLVEDELQKVEKLESISTLAGGIAHDFNNLLTGILGNITLAERYVEKRGKSYDRLVDAERACLRAKDLTHQLLTFSEGGAPIKKPTSIAALLKESATFALSGSNVKCDFCIPDDLWVAEVDETQISRVISNIVINADQAMPQGGMISIMAKNMVIKRRSHLKLPEGNYLEIAIKDNGTGISKKHLSRIFEPFFTTKQKGRGLGLPTAYSIIKNHGGYMTAQSKLGVGTTIYFYVHATTEPLPVAEETVNKSYISGRGSILVMDDEEMIRDMLYNGLSDVGYKIELAADGTEAIEKYTKAEQSGDKFDAVIMDLTIPGGMGGKETIKKLLEIDPNVKAIASSGYANGAVMANFKRYGFVGAVTKPYRFAELEKTLSNVISTPESEKVVHKRRKVQKNVGTGRVRILVMDDAQIVTMALGENLPDLGYEVEFARNGNEAISMYMKALESGHSFDVVLIDLTISDGLGGEETIGRLIQIDPEIRAIVTSGYPNKPAMMKPEKFGFKAAIAKPYSVEELGEVLHKVIEGENRVIV
jgi:PAS domain S-box-containing protein